MIKEGVVYIMKISSESRDWNHDGELYKIGNTTNLKIRKSAIQSFFGEIVDIVALSKVGNRYAAEKLMHTKYGKFICDHPLGINCLNVKEYFLFDEKILSKAIISVWEMPKYYPYDDMRKFLKGWGEA